MQKTNIYNIDQNYSLSPHIGLKSKGIQLTSNETMRVAGNSIVSGSTGINETKTNKNYQYPQYSNNYRMWW